MIIELAEKLLEKKTLGLKEIEAVLGKRPFEPKGSFKAYLEEVFLFSVKDFRSKVKKMRN